MPILSPTSLSTVLAAVTLLLASPCARAGELDVVVGPSLAGSGGNGWSGDGVIPSGQLRVAWRFPVGLGPVFVGREGYAQVDERLLTMLSVGAQGWLDLGLAKPYARIALAHQHEETVSVAKEEPVGVLFGVGRGIRHRAGLSFGAGVDVPFARTGSVEWLACGEAWADWMTYGDAPGPEYYLGGTLGVGIDWTL